MLVVSLSIFPRTATAALVRIPLHLNYPILTAALRQQLYVKGGRAQLWSGDNACQYLYAENPSFGQRNLAPYIETEGFLGLGVPVGENCLGPLAWSGIIQLSISPYVAGFALKLHVTDVNLFDRDHKKSGLVGRGFDLLKNNIVPPFQTFSFDMTPSIRELENLAQMAVVPDMVATVHEVLATLQFEPAVIVEQNGLRLMLDIEMPQAKATPVAASAAPLKPDEIAAWNAALDNWDAFLVFAIKQIGATVSDPEVRATLLNILISSREQLVAALAQPQRIAGADPVRVLFLDEWSRLHEVIETAAAQGRLGNRSLEFLAFISAGDALFALDQAAPALGLTVSAADLRRLARIMAPEATGDPLAYSFDEDPKLRQMFGIPKPLEMPGNLEIPEEPEETPAAQPSPSLNPAQTMVSPPAAAPSPEGKIPQAPAAPAPLPLPSMRPEPATGPVSMLSAAICFAGPQAAGAADAIPGGADSTQIIFELGRKLRDVVVNPLNASVYRTELDQLLTLSARYQLDNGRIDGAAVKVWPNLIKAAAWQESCWRQFVIKNRRVWYLESKSGDIGLMQVNKYVWRGFYSLPRLRWDIVYNASAGCEILMRLLESAATRVQTATPAQLARATYAAYNGGPGAYNRWREAHEPRILREIDDAFWAKYRAVASGQPFDILRCAADWDLLHGA